MKPEQKQCAKKKKKNTQKKRNLHVKDSVLVQCQDLKVPCGVSLQQFSNFSQNTLFESSSKYMKMHFLPHYTSSKPAVFFFLNLGWWHQCLSFPSLPLLEHTVFLDAPLLPADQWNRVYLLAEMCILPPACITLLKNTEEHRSVITHIKAGPLSHSHHAVGRLKATELSFVLSRLRHVTKGEAKHNPAQLSPTDPERAKTPA